jgi:two-component system sensor histidine kinase KdpD
LDQIGLQAENLLMIFVVGVLIVILETKSFWFGAGSALICVVAFNYLFTDPKYTLMVNDPNYYASFVIFLIVAFMVSTLTTKLQREIKISRQNEKTALELYRIGSGYLTVSGKDKILRYAQDSLEELTGRSVRIYPSEEIETQSDQSALHWCYENIYICGFGETQFSREKEKYIPIRSAGTRFGVLAIDCAGKDLNSEELLSVNTVLSLVVLAAQREMLSAQQEENRMRIEKEKLKNNLLRSISHDLRTPLTGISASAEFLKESVGTLDNQTQQTLLDGIRDDADWLGNMVENF